MNSVDWTDLDAIEPVAGFYAWRPGRGHWTTRPLAAVRIWYGPPADPATGLPLDRSWRWQALLNGEPVPLEDVWPWCSHRSPLQGPITEAEYNALMEASDD